MLAAFALGFLVHQQGWHMRLLHLGTAWVKAPRATFTAWRARAALPVVTVDMRFSDYQQLDAVREQALRLGVQVSSEEAVVPATVRIDAEERERVEMRLPEGPVTHLEDDVWPLELRPEETSFWLKLMPVAALGSESTWQQWGYLEALRREDFLTASPSLVQVQFNGQDWGLYLMESPPAAELVLTFDPRPAREAHAAGELLGEEDFRYAAVTVVQGADSPEAARAAARLRAVQAGEMAPSEVCDAEALGRFLALTALWTGQSAPDWRSLHWAYDPTTQQFTPVGAGQPWNEVAPLPEDVLKDPAVQVAYAQALVEFATPAYLEQLRETWGTTLERQWRVLGAEPSSTPWTLLETQQQALRARLTPEHGLAATLEREEAGFVLQLANRQSFPLLIIGLDAGGAGIRGLDPAWVQSEDRALLLEDEETLVLRAAQGSLPQPVRLALPWDLTTAGGDTLFMVFRLWGTSSPAVRAPVKDLALEMGTEP